MRKIPLSENELSSIKPGEVITLTAVMAIVIAAVIAVVVYKLFMGEKGTVKLPGGYQFQWN